jgi:hypothetical protein
MMEELVDIDDRHGDPAGRGAAAKPSVDALEQRLLECERLIGRMRVRQLETLHALDMAGAVDLDGARSLNEWVAARLDTHPDTAAHLSRASRALAEHPDLSDRVARGETSLDRAVAVARLRASGASRATEDASTAFDVAGVWRIAARHRRLRRHDEQDAAARRHLRLQPGLGGMSGCGWFELPGVDFTTIEKALLQRADELPAPPDGAPRESLSTRLADALVAVCQDALACGAHGAGSDAGLAATVFVDAAMACPTNGEAGVATAGTGLRVGPATLEEILCVGTVRVITIEDGRPVSVTARSRAIPPATRDFVLDRDMGCTVDGCQSRYRLQPHHIIPFAAGGGHDPTNLATACWYHHHIVIHQRGYTIDPASPPQRRRLIPPQYSHG